MSTYLLAWSPRRWQWEDLTEMSEAVKAGELVTTRWSCGNSKRIQEGDRAFLIRLGEEPRGIFASGIVTVGSYEDWHWEDEKAAIGETAMFVQVQLDALLDPQNDAILPGKSLDDVPFSAMHWDTQMSGVQIPDEVAIELEKAWASFSSDEGFALPDEIEGPELLYEGAARWISVNAYERSAEARRKGIAHYGTKCYACGFNFAKAYGEAGEGIIHVHHLRQVSEIGKEYKVDPVHDLRPVCPNCHAIIHRRKPPYTLDEVRALLEQASRHGAQLSQYSGPQERGLHRESP